MTGRPYASLLLLVSLFLLITFSDIAEVQHFSRIFFFDIVFSTHVFSCLHTCVSICSLLFLIFCYSKWFMLVSNSNVYIFHEIGYKASSFRYIFVQFLCSNEEHSTNFVILMKKFTILSDMMNNNYLIVTYRLQAKVYLSLLCNFTQEAMLVFLPKVLLQVPLCSSWHSGKQASLPLLQ